jgi:hypothetical protein
MRAVRERHAIKQIKRLGVSHAPKLNVQAHLSWMNCHPFKNMANTNRQQPDLTE